MNWNRGLRRITFILSIIGAIVGAALFYHISAQELKRTEKNLNDIVKRSQLEGESKDDYLDSILFWEKAVKEDRTVNIAATIGGCFFGFCAVWISYAVMKWIIYALIVQKFVWPIYKWISRGFAEDKQKDSSVT